jgi:hypothetical protein
MGIKITITDLDRVLNYFKAITASYQEKYSDAETHFHWTLGEDGWDTKDLAYFIEQMKTIKDLSYLSYISLFLSRVELLNPVYIQADFHKTALTIDCENKQTQQKLCEAWRKTK